MKITSGLVLIVTQVSIPPGTSCLELSHAKYHCDIQAIYNPEDKIVYISIGYSVNRTTVQLKCSNTEVECGLTRS